MNTYIVHFTSAPICTVYNTSELTHRYGSQKSSAFFLLLVYKVIKEFHKALFALEVRKVGQRLQRLGHQREVSSRAFVWVLCVNERNKLM